MNIAFDMSFAKTDSNDRGIGRYSRNLIDSIIRHNPGHSYFYFEPEPTQDRDIFKERLQKFLADHEIDLFHILSPFENLHPAMEKDWFGKTKVAVTLHDVIPLIYPEVYLSQDEKKQAYLETISFIKSCDIVLANSETTRQDAIQRAGIAPSNIAVIPGGIENKFQVIHRNEHLEKTVARYGINKPYVMCTGGMNYRKNVQALIAAFGKANRKRNFSRQLVIVCRLTNEERESLLALAKEAGAADDLVLPGFVPDDELVKLYNGAELFAFPSLYEGFGFPVLEAMACGVPVLTSNNSSLDEIAGDAAYKVNPASMKEIRDGLLELWSDERMRNELRGKGLKRASRFTWKAAGEKAFDAYRNTGRKKVAVFTPLLPLKTGVADYMDTLLPSLSESFECDLYIDDGYDPLLPNGTESNFRVFNHALFHQNHKQYDAVIFQLGNSEYHVYMVPYLRKYPGIVILHDLNLHGLTGLWTLSRRDHDPYLAVLAEDYGRQAREIAQSVTEGRLRRPFSEIVVNAYYLRQAEAILVHNQFAKSELMKKGFRNVAVCGLPVKLPLMISMVYERDFQFSSFGHVTEHKQIDLVLRCIRRLVDQGYTDIRYSVVGEQEPGYKRQLEALVHSLKLEHIVQFHGYVDPIEYQNRICHSDVCVCLRNPTHGESSGSLLHILSHGKPAIITNIDSFREIPGDAVMKIAPGPNAEDQLCNAMARLYQDKALRKSLRQQARSYVAEHHTVSRYVTCIKEMVERGAAGAEAWTDQELSKVSVVQEPLHGAYPGDAEYRRTIVLQPNRYRRVIRDKRPVSYFSFNLAELPPGCTITRAVMHIPAFVHELRVHRIKTPWSVESIARRKPSISPKPIYKYSAAGKTGNRLFAWKCTDLVRKWMLDQLNNHGVYVPTASSARKPSLVVEVIGHGPSNHSH